MIHYSLSRCRPSIYLMGLKSSFTPKSKFCQQQTRLGSTKTNVKQTCLHDFHEKLMAKMQPFAGYMMPIVYKEQTIKSEHLQTRNFASTFDVSHMMQVIVRGKESCKFLESLTVADVQGMKINKCTLSVFLNESGGIIDDCIISKRLDHIHIVSNAGNAEIVWSWLNKNNSGRSVGLERLEGRGLIALQGPQAAHVLQSMVDIDLSEIEFMNTLDALIKGVGVCQITRCGYTGEDGFEISVEQSVARTLMELLCDRKEVKPAGLGARDTLRLEAGLCLHGHDITDKITPVEAGLSWTIHKRRRTDTNFIGSKTILNQLKDGCKLKRAGLVAAEPGPPAREGSQVFSVKGEELGIVTSGNFAPSLNKNIAMAYLPRTLASDYDQRVNCNIRGKNHGYLITKMPFVKPNYFIKKRNNNDVHQLEVSPDTTVAELKQKFEGVPVEESLLYCRGKPLKDNELVGNCVESQDTIEVTIGLLGGKVHGSLAGAGKVKGQTPKVEKQEKKKKKTGRAKRRMQYNRRFVSTVATLGGRKRGPNAQAT